MASSRSSGPLGGAPAALVEDNRFHPETLTYFNKQREEKRHANQVYLETQKKSDLVTFALQSTFYGNRKEVWRIKEAPVTSSLVHPQADKYIDMLTNKSRWV